MSDLEKRAEEYAIIYGIGDNFDVSNYIKFAVSFAQQETKLLSKHLLEMQNTNGALTDRVDELNKLFADCDTCRRTCDIGNCCKFGSSYLPDTEKVLNKNNQLTIAKEIISEYSKWEYKYCDYKRNPDYVTMHCSQCQKYPLHKRAEDFLKELNYDRT